MRKGISAVIATIMLLMITVALIGVFWAFSNTLAESSTTAVGEAATATTERMLKQVAISGEKCGNTTPSNNIINFTVQNIGTKNITADELKVFVDDEENTQTEELAAGLAANAQVRVGVQTATYGKTRSLKVLGPSNAPEKSLLC